MPPELILDFEEFHQTSTRSPTKFSHFYRDPKISFTIYIIAGLTITVLLLLGISCCCYFWCCVPLWKRRKQAQLEALQRAHSNASSKLSLDTDENAGQALMDVEAFEIPILNIPPDPPNFAENSDTKAAFI
uniref:Uncharacterized protein n=1 Tax=Panagrolaimus superbus TaxID=310955 RepID=A0A914Y261_9BILA